MTDAAWATTIAHEHFNGATKEFPVGVWDPVHHYLTSNDLSMESPWTAQANPLNVDPKDVWILADFLQGHTAKNAIAYEFFNNSSFADPSGLQRYLVDRPLIEYCFDNRLWVTQFGRAILYIMNRDIEIDTQGISSSTADHDVLPSYIEDLFRVPNRDFNYMPWYYDLCHLLLIEERRPRDPVTTKETNTEDSIQYYCGVTHHHSNEPRCERAPSPTPSAPGVPIPISRTMMMRPSKPR
ncbi:hypothetical protein BDZ45DRAFT_234561 [Acephala macrosclerotiorum]|nr:hypothetical protein BDZ45DRAFT_234561 [Acephala macrosclerotiorum]